MSPPPPANREVLPLFAAFLCQRRDQITASWMDAVRKNPRLRAADSLDYHELADHLPALFDDLAGLLRGDAVPHRAAQDAESHGEHRWQQDYSLTEVVQELGIISGMVLEQGLDAFQDAQPGAAEGEIRRARKCILDFFEKTVACSIKQYVEKQDAQNAELHEQLRTVDRALAATVQTERDRLADVFRRSPSFMAVTKGPEHVFEMANEGHRKLLAGRDILHKPLREALPEIAGQGFIKRLDHVFTTGETLVGNDVRALLQNDPDRPPTEHYLDFVYQPTHAPDGTIDGVFIHGVDRTERKLAQKALAKLSEQQQLALDSARMGWWHLDVPANQVHWDQRLQTIFGLGQELVSYEQVIARVHPEDRQRLTDVVAASIRPDDPAPCEIEYRVVHDDGSIRWVAARGQATFEGEGADRRAISLGGTLTDITAQKQDREDLAFSAQRERTILESISDGFYALDAGWNFTYINEAAKRSLAPYVEDPNLLLGKNYWDTFPGARGTIIERDFRRTMSEGVTAEFETFYEPWKRWYAVRVSPLRGGGLTNYFRDITGKKSAAEALRDSEAKYRALFDSVDSAFCVLEMIWDEQGNPVDYRFLEVNSNFEKHNGLRDAAGKTALELIPNLERRWFEVFGEVARTRKPVRFTEGSAAMARWFDLYAFPIGEAEPALVATIFSDITERRRAEEALQTAKAEAEATSRAKDEFLATLSHELRTPLNAILGWTQVLRGDPANTADMEAGLATIERNARAQNQIIEDLLDMSAIISGKVRLEVQPLDLDQVVKSAVETMRPAADAKGIRLQAMIDPEARMISGDPNRLQQVFWNLLTNAIKFTPKGGRVQVLLERIHSHLEVSVIDSGEGIAPEFLPYVFDRFRQQDASTTRRHGGLGLGLAIVKQLVELHGGSVHVDSAGLGQGTAFRVMLPLWVIRSAPDAPAEEPRHPHASSHTALPVPAEALKLSGVKVLVVDDEADARALIKRLLEDRGATVRTAGSAAEALQLLAAEKPDVLVSDIGMPGEDGYALIRQVRALPPEQGGTVPAVALTAYARSEDRLKVILAGFQMHMAKPVEAAELLAQVASLTGRVTHF